MDYNKLVRDRIPAIIEQKGEKALTHIANDLEFEAALYQKLEEEAAEFKANPSPEEMADLLEVLRALGEFKGVDLAASEIVRKKKAEERGGFSQRIILESTE